MTKAITILVLTFTAVMWLVLELWLVFRKDTPISVFMKDGALEWMFVPLGWGILTGHFFMTWPSKEPMPFGDKLWFVWVAIAVVVIASDIIVAAWHIPRESIPSAIRIFRTPFLMCMIGIAAGFLFWPQRIDM